MPLGLHADCLRRLNQLITDSLSEVRAKNGMFIERLSCWKLIVADSALPQTGKIREQLKSYIDEFPLTEFVIETIGQELWELDRYLSDQTVSLHEIAEYADAPAVARRLVDDFESLPWQYQVTVGLPEALTDILPIGNDSIELSPHARIVRPTAAFDAEYPLTHGSVQRTRRMKGSIGLLALLAEPEVVTWDSSQIYLQFLTEGFIGQYGASATAYEVERTLRAFFGIGIATRLFKHEYTYSSSQRTPPAYVHRLGADGKWTPTTRYDLSDSIGRGIGNLIPIR